MNRVWSRKRAEERQNGMLWSFVLALTILGSSRLAGAQARLPGVEWTDLKIKLRTYNYGISLALLTRAEGEADAILGQAGLEVVWVDCPLTAAELQNYPACQDSMGTTDFVLMIFPARRANRYSTHHEALGEALDCRRDQVGCAAYVFYRDVLELARGGEAAEFQLLGHALAHEIGHLLLGPNSHSATGIMRAKWDRRDLQTIARAHLFFNDQQSKRIRDEVSARNTMRQAPRAGAFKP